MSERFIQFGNATGGNKGFYSLFKRILNRINFENMRIGKRDEKLERPIAGVPKPLRGHESFFVKYLSWKKCQ